MNTRTRKTLTQLAAITVLGNAGAAAAEDKQPWDFETEYQEEHGTYPLYDGTIAAVMRFDHSFVSVTTRPDASDTNWHLVTILIDCEDNGGSYRAIVALKQAQTVYNRCPNSEGDPTPYFVKGAYARVQDIDDATFDPDSSSFPTNSNEPFVTVTEPNPEDTIPPRPSNPG